MSLKPVGGFGITLESYSRTNELYSDQDGTVSDGNQVTPL